MKLTNYKITTEKQITPFTAAVVADLHNCLHTNVLRVLEREKPELILIPGDLMSSLSDPAYARENERGFVFLKEAASIAPVFYALGNHEQFMTDDAAAKIEKTGAVLLADSSVCYHGMLIGGVVPGKSRRMKKHCMPPDISFFDDFVATGAPERFRILLCHNPEYYPAYLRGRGMDLIVSGHAHGGQWRLFGHGIFAPGQGLFPAYTEGVHDHCLVISRGLGDRTIVPRLFNPHELVFVSVGQ